MSSCNPKTIDEAYAGHAQPAEPANQELPEPAPGAGQSSALPDGAQTNPEFAGSLPAIEAQLELLRSILKNEADTSVSSASVYASGSEQYAVEREQLHEETFSAKQQLARVRDHLRQLQSQETDVSRFYDKGVVPSVNMLNALTKTDLTFSDIDSLLENTLIMLEGDSGGPDALKAVREFKNTHLNPLFAGLQSLQSGIDIWGTGASFLDATTRFLGPDNVLSKRVAQAQTNIRHIEEALAEGAEMLAIINETMDLVQGFLMAACKLLAALKQFAYNLGWIMANLGDLLPTLLLNLIPGNPTWFRVPRPLSLFLMQVDGLMSRLAGFDEVGKCFNQVFDRSNPSGQLNLPGRQAQPNALKLGLDNFVAGLNLTVSQTLAGAIADLLGLKFDIGVPNPFDPIRAALQAKLQPNKLQPPRPVVLPEHGALLGFLSSAQMLLGFIPKLLQGELFKPGATLLSPERLYAMSADGSKTALTPHPAYTVDNMIQSTRMGWLTILVLQAWIAQLEATASAIRAGYFSDDEAAQRQALADLAAAKAKAAAMANAALDKGLNNPTKPARDKQNCDRVDDQGRGNGGSDNPANNPPDAADLEDKFKGLFGNGSGGAGLPNSVVVVGATNNPSSTQDGSATPPGVNGLVPQVTVNTVFDNLPGSVLPTDMTSEYRGVLAGYVVLNGLNDFQDLPMLLLLKDNTGRSQFDRLRYLSNLLESQRSVPLVKLAHETLLSKTNNQGLRVDSPYTWLAEGLSLVGDLNLLDWVEKFLLHDEDFDLRPIAAWWAQAAQIDFTTPIASGLTDDEYACAQASYAYLNVYTPDPGTIADLVLWMRLRADATGGLAGYEFYLLTAVLTAIKRITLELIAGGDFVTIAKQAKLVADKMTHQELVDGLLDGLYED